MFALNDVDCLNTRVTLNNFLKYSNFTDDTVMTVAIAKTLLESDDDTSLRSTATLNMQIYGKKYPLRGYGFSFNKWLQSTNPQPYYSYGNGGAMRVSSVAYFADSIEELKVLVAKVTDVTHNHPEGIKGAEATAVCIWLALHNTPKTEIKKYIENNYYKLDFEYDQLLKTYKYDMTCQGSVPQSLYAFFISDNYEDTIRTAISLGGDADTMACISGGIAAAYYGIPESIVNCGLRIIPEEMKKIVLEF